MMHNRSPNFVSTAPLKTASWEFNASPPKKNSDDYFTEKSYSVTFYRPQNHRHSACDRVLSKQ